MTVDRNLDQKGPATLTVFFTSPSKPSSMEPSATASEDNLSDRTEIIDMKYKHEREILLRLMDAAGGTPCATASDDEIKLRELEDYKKNSERDRQAQARLNEVKRQEKALLDQARGVAVAAT